MLLMKDLIDGVNEMYIPMLKKVSICDFTKCIAQFSGIRIQELDDEIIKIYLRKWAENKYRFFGLLGNELRKDFKINYTDQSDVDDKYLLIQQEFPAYAHWLDIFKYCKINKIESRNISSWDFGDSIRNYLRIQERECYNIPITHFFKKYLNASDELITAIGRIYENRKVNSNYTISIDPVDIMLSSENPYNWCSCYRLELDNYDSHADGCLAAVLDNSSLVTYIWNNEGKFSLYDTYDLKKVRYKKIRQTISISPSMKHIHFNSVYPGKERYSEDFLKQMREICENIVAEYIGLNSAETIWTNGISEKKFSYCERKFLYGYGEYNCSNIYGIKESEPENWNVFNERILCPAAYKYEQYLPGSDSESEIGEEIRYNGNGFIANNFYYDEWEVCEYSGEPCHCAWSIDEYNCENCFYYDNHHPVCDLDINELCERFEYDEDKERINNGVIEHNEENCHKCPLFKFHCGEAKIEYRSNETIDNN